MLQFTTILLPVATLILGAFLQHYLSKSARKSDEVLVRQQQAYIDYLTASVTAKFGVGSNRETALSKLIDAKLRIVVYGSEKVVSQLAEFERQGAVLDNDRSLEAYLDLAQKMRANSDQDAKRSDLSMIIFGPS